MHVNIPLNLTSSDSGPHNSGPRQKPKTYTVIVRLATSSENEKCAIRSVTIPEAADEANVLYHLTLE